MISVPVVLLALVVAYLLSNSAASAQDMLTAAQLSEVCSAEAPSVNSHDCQSFLHGFLAGAIKTDPRLLSAPMVQGEEGSTITERAMKTRMPGRGEQLRPSRPPMFCLDSPSTLQLVVDKVAADLQDLDPQVANSPAVEVISASLRKHYPCRD